MIECKTVTRKWGNSIGITLPKEVVEDAKIKENEKVVVLILKQNKNLNKMFGLLKGRLKQSAQQLKDELRAELYND